MNYTSVQYMISRQGNRNLAFGRDENIFYDTPAEARKEALRRTKRDAEPWFVYQVDATLKYAYRPDVKEEVWNGGTE